MKENLPSLKLTFSHLKIDGWKTIVSFWVSFLVGAMLVSGRVILEIPSRERSHIPFRLALLNMMIFLFPLGGICDRPPEGTNPFSTKKHDLWEKGFPVPKTQATHSSQCPRKSRSPWHPMLTPQATILSPPPDHHSSDLEPPKYAKIPGSYRPPQTPQEVENWKDIKILLNWIGL